MSIITPSLLIAYPGNLAINLNLLFLSTYTGLLNITTYELRSIFLSSVWS